MHTQKIEKRRFMQSLKLIGVVLFLWIVRSIDFVSLLSYIQSVDPTIFSLSFCVVFCLYAAKAIRWHVLVRSTGIHPSPEESWKVFNIGVFLGMITPAKLGELGRAAYLHKHGLDNKKAIALSIVDRIADSILILFFALPSSYVLLGSFWTVRLVLLGIGAVIILFVATKYTKLPDWISQLQVVTTPKVILIVTTLTIAGWALYFTWAILIARSIGIVLPVPLLASIFTMTGVLSMLPIAPSGLGTRDAALVTFLGMYGIQAEQAVALALLMFTSIVLSSIPGGWYWLTTSSRQQVDSKV